MGEVNVMTWGQTETDSVSLQAEDSERLPTIDLTFFAVVSASALLWGTTALGQSLPNGGSVAAGDVTITQPNGNQMTINQGSDAAIVNWNGFSIGSGSRVDINQPGQGSVILNRVTGNTTSQIHGQLNANGQVHLVNPNGIFIGPTGHVNTAGFVASTLAISDDDFLNGQYRYRGNGNSQAVENAGTITVVPGGYAALIGGRVSNSGLIRVPLGKVGLGAGEQVTLDISGDGFLQVAVPSDSDDDVMEALVSNSGRIEADGGLVHLKVASARDAARQVVNMSGVIEARSVGGVSGAVVLGGAGGAVHVSGTIDTSARKTLVASSPRPVVRPQAGGDITITGEAIELAGATLDASGAGAADGGSIRVGGDLQGQGDLQRAQTTTVDAGTRLIADGGAQGNGGTIIVWSDYFTSFSGFNSARGGDEAGNGGFVEVSGKYQLSYSGLTDTRAPFGTHGTLLLDPSNIEINSSGDPGTVAPATIVANLDLGDVIVTTAGTGELIPGSGPPIDLGGPDGEPGNITVEEAIIWTSSSTLTLIADNDIDINAAITASLGGLELDAGGTIATGSGGTIDVASFSLLSGAWVQNGSSLPAFFAGDFSISQGASFLRALGGSGSAASPYQITDVYGLQGIGSAGLDTASFELANDIDASGTADWGGGFEPIETFSGSLDGDRFTIDGLVVDQGGDAAMFDTIEAAGSVSNLSITNADIDGSTTAILAVTNEGLVSGVSVGGSVVAENFGGGSIAAGLVVSNFGTIEDSFSTASVEAIFPIDASDFFLSAAGLVSDNVGTIERSNSSGPVILTSQTGGGDGFGAGLVTFNTGIIRDSYSTSSITANNIDDTVTIGGLVVDNDINLDFGTVGTIERTYATGAITSNGAASTTFGGLVVDNLPGASVSSSFWNRQTTGVTTSDGGTSLTTAQLQDTESFYNRARAQGWDFTSVWAPGTGSTNPANYTTSPVVFAIPDDVAVTTSETSSATTTGTVYGGPSVYRFGPQSDTLSTSSIFGDLDFADTSAGTTTFTVGTSSVTSSDGQVYNVAALPGVAVITDDTTIIPVPPTPTIEVTPTVDTTITGEGGGGTAVTTVAEAEAALGTVENASQEFDGEVAACASEGNDVSQYLACLAEAMDDYAADLDAIVKGLPPGLESVGDIIRGASAGIRAAGDEANRKLALATTAEERAAIRREAVQAARREIQQAQREIRKAITLIRATDPELVTIQNQQVETIVAAVGQAEIGLTRAIGL
ncbi:MAG: filamentous hemagglutinin N-terminal domain-containing protein [Ruegeria sp.]